MILRSLLAALILLSSSQAIGQVYRCTVNGHATYQQTPCPSSSKSSALPQFAPNTEIAGCYADDRQENKLRVSGSGATYTVEASPIRAGRTFSIPMRLVRKNELPIRYRSPNMKWFLAANPKEWTSVFYKYVDERTGEPKHLFILLGNHEFNKVECR